MPNDGRFESLDDIMCGEIVVATKNGLLPDVPAHNIHNQTVKFIDTNHPKWMDVDGTVPDNCPRNPEFSGSKELGCFACGNASLSYANGSLIVIAPNKQNSRQDML